MVGLASKRAHIAQAGEVKAYYAEGGVVYVEAPIGANRVDVLNVITEVESKGYHAGDQNDDEETANGGLRMRFLRALTQRGIGLLSTPLLMGVGAIAASADFWLQVPTVVIG